MLDRYFIKGSTSLDWNYIETIPEFAKLNECEQNPKWHGEGNAMKHTKKCVEAAYNLLLDEMYSDLCPKAAIAAVLFHDIGKSVSTEFIKGNWHAYNHEYTGERIARRLLWDEELSFREFICSCVRLHMKVLNVAESKKIVDDVIALSRTPFVSWRYLLFVKHCDILGSVPVDEFQTLRDIDSIYTVFDVAENIGALDGKFRLKTSLADRAVFRPICGKKTDSTVYVLIGLPGAGKNTYVDTHLGGVKMISRDDIRAELGYCKSGDKVVLSKEQEDEVTKVFNEEVMKYVKAGENICLNNINLKKRYRDSFKTLLQGYPVKWEYVYIEAPTIEDNIKRRPTFDPEVLMSMRETLEWPQPDEYDDLIISKQ